MTAPELNPTPTPPVSPPSLVGRIGELAYSVEGLRLAVDREREARERETSIAQARIDAANRAHKRSTWALGTVILLLLIGTFVVLAQNAENREQQRDLEAANEAQKAAADQRLVDQCVSGNAARKSIRDSFDQYTAALVGASANANRTPEEQAAADARIAAFKADLNARLAPLADRDCSPEALGVQAPPPAVLS